MSYYNTVIYIIFKPEQNDLAIAKIENAVEIKVWIVKNILCLNGHKTEVLISSKYAQQKLNIPHNAHRQWKIFSFLQAKNIGFVFDHIMDCQDLN